jgi:flagellar L-ring protein FlgH
LNFAGQGSTTRSGQLQASLTARVCEVLPNGDLVIEGTKDVTVNRERQSLTIRGVIRTRDVSPYNVVFSTAISHMEVKFDGKGVVSDANKPGFLYWLLSKITPF